MLFCLGNKKNREVCHDDGRTDNEPDISANDQVQFAQTSDKQALVIVEESKQDKSEGVGGQPSS